VQRVVRRVTGLKKGWKQLFGKEDDDGIKRGSREAQTKKFIPGEEDTLRGGSLTRFRTDEWYDQHGKGLMTDLLRGGFQGLKSTQNPLKLPSNIKRGLETGFTRGVKRKAEVIKKEITKRAKKALSNKNVKEAVRVASALFPKQTKRARDIFGV